MSGFLSVQLMESILRNKNHAQILQVKRDHCSALTVVQGLNSVAAHWFASFWVDSRRETPVAVIPSFAEGYRYFLNLVCLTEKEWGRQNRENSTRWCFTENRPYVYTGCVCKGLGRGNEEVTKDANKSRRKSPANTHTQKSWMKWQQKGALSPGHKSTL